VVFKWYFGIRRSQKSNYEQTFFFASWEVCTGFSWFRLVEKFSRKIMFIIFGLGRPYKSRKNLFVGGNWWFNGLRLKSYQTFVRVNNHKLLVEKFAIKDLAISKKNASWEVCKRNNRIKSGFYMAFWGQAVSKNKYEQTFFFDSWEVCTGFR
jgi:hypothetical protein